jgi:hypothetical protein
MAIEKPRNHVTEALAVEAWKPGAALPPMPEVPEDLLKWLEMVYPPRHYAPGEETLEQHLIEAGKAGLVQELRRAHDAASHAETGELGEEEEELLSHYEAGAFVPRRPHRLSPK